MRVAWIVIALAACGDDRHPTAGCPVPEVRPLGTAIDERCLDDGGCIELPRLRGRTAFSFAPLSATSPQSIWAFGAGELVHWDELGLHSEPDRSGAAHISRVVEACGVVYGLAGGHVLRRLGPGEWADDGLPDDVVQLGTGDAWARGARGIWHRDATWTLSLEDPTVEAMVAAAPDNVWVAAARGTLHFDGTGWTQVSELKFPATLPGADAFSPDASEVLVVAPSGQGVTLFRQTATGRDQADVPAAVSATPSLHVTGTGRDDVTIFYDRQRFHFDGAAVTELPPGDIVRDAVTAGGATITLAGDDLDLVRTDGDERTAIRDAVVDEPPMGPQTAGGAWGLENDHLSQRGPAGWTRVASVGPHAHDVFVDGAGLPWWIDDGGLVQRTADGTLARRGAAIAGCARPDGRITALAANTLRTLAGDGTQLSEVAVPAPPQGFAVTPLFCAGDDVWTPALVVDGAGPSTRRWTSGNRAIAVAADDVWSVGTVVSHRLGGLVRTFDLGAMTDVAASDAANVWIVGSGGRAVRWDGATFTAHPTGANDTLVDVQPVAADDVTAVTMTGDILHWNGAAWTRRGSSIGAGTLFDATIVSPSEGYAVGVDATGTRLFTWNGTTWTPSTISTTPHGSVQSAEMYFRSPTDIWYFDHQTAFQLRGTTWTEQTALVQPSFPLAAFAVTGTDAFALDAIGRLFRNTAPDTWAQVATVVHGGDVATLVPIGGGELFTDGGAPQRIAGATVTRVDEIGIPVEVRRASDGALRVVDHFGTIWKDAGGHRFVAVPSAQPPTVLATARLRADDDVWAIADGSLVRFDGATWSIVSTGPSSGRATSLDLRGTTLWVTAGNVVRFGPP